MFQKFRIYFKSIVGKVYMGWQLLFDIGMKPCMMAHMDEIGLFGTNTSGSLQRLRNTLVRRMRLWP